MPQISTTIQNLLNGVSQQADSQKFPSQAQEQINGFSSPAKGLLKRNPTKHVAKVFNSVPTDVFSQALNRDSSERYMVTVRATAKKTVTSLDTGTEVVNCTAHGFVDGDEVRFYGDTLGSLNQTARFYVINKTTNDFQVSLTSGGSAVDITDAGSGTQQVSLDPLSIYDLINKTEKAVTTTNSADYLVTTTPSTVLKATSIADYSFMLNNSVTVAMDASLTTDTRNKGYVYVKQGDYGTDYKITIDGTAYPISTPDGSVTTHRPQIDTEYIAAQLVTQIGSPTGFTITRVGSTIEIKKVDTSDFELTISDSLGDGAMGAIKNDADAFTDLPIYCRDGQRVQVKGDVENNLDDYYVKFTADAPINEPFGRGKWSEAAAPNVKYKLDASTFCHTLIRESSGDFTFKQGTWGERLAGDETTASDPSFVGSTIKNIVLFRDRLGFLSGENISLSETGEYFNFFRTTVTQLLGTDPVDVRASHNKVSNLYSAVPFSRNLLLFSDKTQFMLTGGDVLTPSSVSISQETEFEVATNADPIVSGHSCYFPFSRGDFSGVMEYFISPDVEQMSGDDATAHIPKYIAGNITKITANSVEPVVAISASGLTNGIYVYRYLNRGREKLQASWSKFEFDAGSTVENIDFIGKDLYIVVSRASGLYIESLSFKEAEADTSADYVTLLDRRVQESDCTVTYDATVEQTTIVLPYISYGTVELSTRADGSSEEAGQRLVPLTQAGTTLTLDGDLSSRKFWAGDKYTFTYTMNKPYLKMAAESSGKSKTAIGRFQVRNGIVTFDDSSTFSVSVTPDNRSTNTYTFDSKTLNSSGFTLGGPQVLKDGSFKFPVRSRGDRVTIEITNDTPYPCALLTVEYEATYYTRFQQV
jgi:hypothetical protein